MTHHRTHDTKDTQPSTRPPPLALPATAALTASDLVTTDTETALDRKQAVLRDVAGAVADGGLLGMYLKSQAGKIC
jgi:hypothetical protein